MEELLEVEDLCKYFQFKRTLGEMASNAPRTVKAVDNVSFNVTRGETLGLVGESGCGKTTTTKVILRLLKPTSGRVIFEGKDIHGKLARSELSHIHREIQAVFQDPAGSLDPRMTVGQSIREPMDIHKSGNTDSREDRVSQMLQAVGLTPEQYHRYPHELSGGQQQRVAIARALTLQPKIVILDEPVSALDMSVRTQILNLLKDLQSRLDLTYLFVAHDLSVVRYMCDHVAVMYLGQIVEYCSTSELYENPIHPYTKALLEAVPVPDPSKRRDSPSNLKGSMPSPINLPTGCRFHTRCPYAVDLCGRVEPKLIEVSKGHLVSCHLADTFLSDASGSATFRGQRNLNAP
jgi:oligopeptide/dipeptide ABC transporter ATP-binding protein